jgi:hypothetical protein
MRGRIGVITAAVALILAGSSALAQRGGLRIGARLEPRQEVPSVVSSARGSFSARILDATIEYALDYEGLQGDVRQAHIHLAQPSVNGPIIVWLCGTTQNPGPAGTQTCPQSGTVTGVISASDVMASTTQGIETGDFSDFVRGLREGSAYANVHTTQSPGGEIRGQITVGRQNTIVGRR